MKVLLQDYTFNAAASEIKFNVTDVVKLNSVLIITNVTSNVIIYNFANPLQGGTILNNVLKLDYNTSSMSSSDTLQIFLDLYGSPSTETTSVATNESIKLLRRLLKAIEPISIQDSNQRQRITVDNGSINISTYGSIDPRWQIVDWARTAYATGIRAKIN
jgi:hypothetical protein